MEAPKLAETAHARRHSEQPLHDIQIVKALVQEDAAALAFPGRPPTAAGVVGLGSKPIGHDPAHPDNLPNLTALDQLLDFEVTRLGAKLEHTREHGLGILFVRGDQPLGISFMG